MVRAEGKDERQRALAVYGSPLPTSINSVSSLQHSPGTSLGPPSTTMDFSDTDRKSNHSSSSRRRHASAYQPRTGTDPPVPDRARAGLNLAPQSRQRAVSSYDSPSSSSYLDPSGLKSRRRERAGSPAESDRSRSASKASQGGNYYQPFPVDAGVDWPEAAEVLRTRKSTKSLLSERSGRTDRTGDSERRRRKSARAGGEERLWSDSASESGYSVLSAFGRQPGRDASKAVKEQKAAEAERRAQRDATDSPLRRASRWLHQNNSSRAALWIGIGLILVIKSCIGLGGYSGESIMESCLAKYWGSPDFLLATGRATPPIRGDFEAQRHWLALTSSSLNNLNLPFLRRPSSAPSYNATLPLSSWYFHDLPYWGLDYPPLTAYHSLLLGAIARLSPRTAEYVTLRPPTYAEPGAIAAWESNFAEMEERGEMKSWMRGTVVVGDLLVWVSAVVAFCRRNYGKGKGHKGARASWVGMMSILLQPGLILIDNGHFQ
jgi:hypothetical protein